MTITIQQANAIKAWRDAKAAAASAVIAERNLRAEMVALCFPEAKIGTNNLDIGQGYKLKYVKSLNYKLDTGDVDAVTGLSNTDRALDTIRSTGNEGAFIADRLVKWKPELSLTEYKALSDTFKKIINTVVTTSDASPEVEMVPPKA
jgi:hypothetical protein